MTQSASDRATRVTAYPISKKPSRIVRAKSLTVSSQVCRPGSVVATNRASAGRHDWSHSRRTFVRNSTAWTCVSAGCPAGLPAIEIAVTICSSGVAIYAQRVLDGPKSLSRSQLETLARFLSVRAVQGVESRDYKVTRSRAGSRTFELGRPANATPTTPMIHKVSLKVSECFLFNGSGFNINIAITLKNMETAISIL